MDLIEIILFIPVCIFFFVSAYNFISHPFLIFQQEVTKGPLVSVLIPAKNEVNRISDCLATITKQNYSNYEIIVLDDDSDDGTYEFIQREFPEVKVIKGEKRPPKWVGKNWACHQLSQIAKGDILIFTDADNFYENNAISKSIGRIIEKKLDMFSVFPHQKNKSISEKIFVPIVDNILYSLLPLDLTYKLEEKSLSAANGQWICISKEAYLDVGGHEALKEEWTEDIMLSKKIKARKYKLLVNSGSETIYTRMYSGFSKIVNGFEKNLYYMLGGNTFSFIFTLVLFSSTIISPIYLYYSSDLNIFLIYISILFAWKYLIAIISAQNKVMSILYHPILILFMIYESIRSYNKIRSGKVKWKGVGN